MSVVLPSSTEPMVAKRSRRCAARTPGNASEVALALAVLHRRLREAVVGAGGAALGDPADLDLGDDLAEGRRRRPDRAGARRARPSGSEPARRLPFPRPVDAPTR